MGEWYTGCENIFTYKCSGEVVNLLRAAERYGILREESRRRVETICRNCRNRSLARVGEGAVKRSA